MTPEFREEYEKYLQGLGQPPLVVKVALTLVTFTTEETLHTISTGDLQVTGRNPRGVWDRVLECTGETGESFDVKTADNEVVKARSWWDGRIHNSCLIGTKKYGGGDFRSKRYIDDDGYYVCESTFEPSKEGRAKANITWKFESA